MKFIPFLLQWYFKNKREFPWRETKDFYKIWVCEVIFQQTRINQGLDYYTRFIAQFPTLASLAIAKEQDVLLLWQGLGYYSRARNLHFSAQYIYNNLNNFYPNNYNDILKLKGVGSYTAAAISSICYNEKVPAIDGNALRVYARLFNDFSDVSSAATKKKYFNKVLPFLKSNPAGDYNQAIMELGALVCLPKKPKCNSCPITDYCLSFKMNTQEKLPVKLKLIKVVNETMHYFFIWDGVNFIIQKRTKNEIWKNLFEFSTKKYNYTSILSEKVIKHKLTHKNLNIIIKEIILSPQDLNLLIKKEKLKSISFDEIENYPFPIIFKNFFKHYFK